MGGGFTAWRADGDLGVQDVFAAAARQRGGLRGSGERCELTTWRETLLGGVFCEVRGVDRVREQVLVFRVSGISACRADGELQENV
jgi:hypothetical protein